MRLRCLCSFREKCVLPFALVVGNYDTLFELKVIASKFVMALNTLQSQDLESGPAWIRCWGESESGPAELATYIATIILLSLESVNCSINFIWQ